MLHGQYCPYNIGHIEYAPCVPDIKHGQCLDDIWLHTIIYISVIIMDGIIFMGMYFFLRGGRHLFGGGKFYVGYEYDVEANFLKVFMDPVCI